MDGLQGVAEFTAGAGKCRAAGGEGLAVRVVPGDEGRKGRLGLSLRAGHGGEVVAGQADLLPEGSDAAPRHGRFVFGVGGRVGARRTGEDRAGACENGRGQEDADGCAAERGMKTGGFHGFVPLARASVLM
ncbi:MAG: hypothetical protein R6X20_09850 [Phycisphaerae bacterium]